MSLPPSRQPTERQLVSLILFFAWLIVFGPVLFTNDVLFYRDQLITTLPVRQYLHERLMQGELPQWYPYEGLGVPLIGQIATGHFHPGLWLFAWMPAAIAAKWSISLSYLLGSVGAYRFARVLQHERGPALVAALAAGYSGYAFGVSNNTAHVLSQAALPWIAYFAFRFVQTDRWNHIGPLGLLWGSLFLAGDLPSFLFCSAFLAMAWLQAPTAKRALGLVTAGVIAALVLCVELLPAQVFAAQSVRVLGEGSATIGRTFALHPWRLFELFIPGFVPDPVRHIVVKQLFGQGSAVFSTTIFVGSVTLLLATLGAFDWQRRRLLLPFVCMAGLCTWLAMGDFGGLLPLVKQVIPLFVRFRYPEKYFSCAVICLIPLVAAGVVRLRTVNKRVAPAAALLALVFVVVSLLPGLPQLVWSAAALGTLSLDVEKIIHDDWAFGLACSALALGLLSLAVWRLGKEPRMEWAIGLLVFAELASSNAAHVPVTPPDFLQTQTPFAKTVLTSAKDAAPADRVFNEALVDVPLTIHGDDHERWVAAQTFSLKPNVCGLFDVTCLGENLGATNLRHGLVFGPKGVRAAKFASLFNGCFRVSSQPSADPQARTLLYQQALGYSLSATPCQRRAFLAQPETAPSLAEALAKLEAGQVVWEGPNVEGSAGTVEWLEYAPESVRLRVHTTARTALIVSDAYAPGWTAKLDGADTPIYPALVAARGVVVPPGDHEVDFTYNTPRLAVGASASLLGWLIAGALIAFQRKPRVALHRQTR